LEISAGVHIGQLPAAFANEDDFIAPLPQGFANQLFGAGINSPRIEQIHARIHQHVYDRTRSLLISIEKTDGRAAKPKHGYIKAGVAEGVLGHAAIV